MSTHQNTSPIWNVTYARSLSLIALMLPIIGGVVYHEYGQHFIGRALHAFSVITLFLMPVMFRETLNLVFKSRGLKDELQQSWHDQAVRKSYRVVIGIAWVLFLIAAFATKWAISTEELSDLMMTFSMITIAYAFIVPFSFLVWSVKPLSDE